MALQIARMRRFPKSVASVYIEDQEASFPLSKLWKAIDRFADYSSVHFPCIQYSKLIRLLAINSEYYPTLEFEGSRIMHSRWRSIPCSPTSGTTCRRRRATTRWRGSGPSISKSLDSWIVMDYWSWIIEVLKISLQSPSKRISVGCVNSLCKDTESRNLEKSFFSYLFSPIFIFQDHHWEEGLALHHHLLHPERALRRGQLGLLPHPLRRHSGEPCCNSTCESGTERQFQCVIMSRG